MMFGALKGMRFVEREQKSNLALEHRLEELAVKKFPCDLLISFIPKYTGTHLTYGIDVCCKYWMSQGETVAILSMAANLDKVKAVYELIARDKAYKVEKLECFEKPCKIILCESLDDPYAYMCDVYTVDELKTHIKDTKIIKEYTKKHPMSIQYDSFLKKYIQNDKWYSAVFAKYCEDIQCICRR
jgi:hypothetical protein